MLRAGGPLLPEPAAGLKVVHRAELGLPLTAAVQDGGIEPIICHKILGNSIFCRGEPYKWYCLFTTNRI